MVSFVLNAVCTEGGNLSGNIQYSAVVFDSPSGLTASVDATQWLAGNTLLARFRDFSRPWEIKQLKSKIIEHTNISNENSAIFNFHSSLLVA